ncbi:hypothetical protein E2C01_077323 [Portunus trituberculatus]|uniref:Uncharacterized protein n=1 Tax=Portunus trituberculatus TaxID=210409 RepID=A0A5B7IPF3_PORTR|nr:hypothetical protein [Portunus trituberculatus]
MVVAGRSTSSHMRLPKSASFYPQIGSPARILSSKWSIKKRCEGRRQMRSGNGSDGSDGEGVMGVMEKE